MVERQSDDKFKDLKTDGGGENASDDFGRYCDQEGTIHEVIPVRPQFWP